MIPREMLLPRGCPATGRDGGISWTINPVAFTTQKETIMFMIHTATGPITHLTRGEVEQIAGSIDGMILDGQRDPEEGGKLLKKIRSLLEDNKE